MLEKAKRSSDTILSPCSSTPFEGPERKEMGRKQARTRKKWRTSRNGKMGVAEGRSDGRSDIRQADKTGRRQEGDREAEKKGGINGTSLGVSYKGCQVP